MLRVSAVASEHGSLDIHEDPEALLGPPSASGIDNSRLQIMIRPIFREGSWTVFSKK